MYDCRFLLTLTPNEQGRNGKFSNTACRFRERSYNVLAGDFPGINRHVEGSKNRMSGKNCRGDVVQSFHQQTQEFGFEMDIELMPGLSPEAREAFVGIMLASVRAAYLAYGGDYEGGYVYGY